MYLFSVGIANSSNADEWITHTLESAQYNYEECSAEMAAIVGTISRKENIELPDYGKVIVVNIASGIVTAYEDGIPVIESKGVVGKANTPTPEMSTHVTFVRPNPTWTVPKSIIKRNNWLDRLSTEPDFFDRNNFKITSNGRTISAYEASYDPESVDSFMQMPGQGNALGLIKIGIQNNQAIYLHDTNSPEKFNEEVRAASAGCVRIDKIYDIASWVLDISPDSMNDLIESNNTENLTPPEEVKVILGYWTAWPDSSGRVRFYPDIYGKDNICGQQHTYTSEPNDQHYDSRTKPRFIPHANNNEPATPQWTVYEATR